MLCQQRWRKQSSISSLAMKISLLKLPRLIGCIQHTEWKTLVKTAEHHTCRTSYIIPTGHIPMSYPYWFISKTTKALPVTIIKFYVYEMLILFASVRIESGDSARVQTSYHLAPVSAHSSININLSQVYRRKISKCVV